MSRNAAQRVSLGLWRVSQRQNCLASTTKYGTRWQSTLERKWSTPLAKALTEAITTTGPISIASYMRQCLTSDLGGYYTREQDGPVDQFGRTGDFVTSPEISQIFGELVGLWFYTEWLMQKPSGPKGASAPTEFIEFGPGRGTLMSDVLRTIANFANMAAAVQRIYLVEASQALKETQAKLLCSEEPKKQDDGSEIANCKLLPSAEIVWVEHGSFLPKEESGIRRFIVAHEFFDALPIHAFRSVASKPSAQTQRQNITGEIASPEERQTKQLPDKNEAKPGNQWHELLVNPTAPPSPFDKPSDSTVDPRPEFELIQSSGPTHHSRLLPAISERYQALLAIENATIEISPLVRSTAAQIARLIGPGTPATAGASAGGAALIVDYGPAETVPTNSLRGIRAHNMVSPFAEAGRTDISADVDFGALVEAALEGSEEVEVHGPVGQGDWLRAMGGSERLGKLMERAENDEVREALRKGWERLIDLGPNGMGRLYKCLAVVPYNEGKRRPVGFGGSVRT